MKVKNKNEREGEGRRREKTETKFYRCFTAESQLLINIPEKRAPSQNFISRDF